MIDIDEATKKYEPKKENDNDANGDDTVNNTSGGAKGSSVYTPQYD